MLLIIRYSIEARDRIFLKGHRFSSFAKCMSKNIGTNISKTLSGEAARIFLIVLNYLLQIHLKLLQRQKFKNQQKLQVI